MNFRRSVKKTKRAFNRHFWWFVLAACLAALLAYGLWSFNEQPKVETITTHAPVFNANNNQMREVDYKLQRRQRR